jgi:hypothetical protein
MLALGVMAQPQERTMKGPTIRWLGAGLVSLIIVSAACREKQPPPPHNRNLGEGERYLLPTPPVEAGPELSGNRRIEIIDRSEARAVEPTGEPESDTQAEAAAPAEAASAGRISGFVRWLRGSTDEGSADAGAAEEE